MRTFSQADFYRLNDHLANTDPDLGAIISRYGYPPLWNRPNTFETLVHIILEQQVSLASALAALNKLRGKLQAVTPENILRLSDEEMKACYCSRQKTGYIRLLAGEMLDRKLELGILPALPDEKVRTRLMNIKGIGRWTADIYLIFVLQRADVFPSGDLAATNALRKVKHIDKKEPLDTLISVAEQWQPYRTIATMLLWHEYLSSAKLRTARF